MSRLRLELTLVYVVQDDMSLSVLFSIYISVMDG